MRRVGEVARVPGFAGVLPIVAVVSPHSNARAEARACHEAAGLGFVEVWLSTPLAVCERRDPKGLHARARAGELDHLTGVDDPHERPEAPEVQLDPGRDSVEQCVDAVLATLAGRVRARRETAA